MKTDKPRVWHIKEKRYVPFSVIDYDEQEIMDVGGFCTPFSDVIFEWPTTTKDVNKVDLFDQDRVSYDAHFSGDNFIRGGIGYIKWNEGSFVILNFSDEFICEVSDVYNLNITKVGTTHDIEILANPELLENEAK